MEPKDFKSCGQACLEFSCPKWKEKKMSVKNYLDKLLITLYQNVAFFFFFLWGGGIYSERARPKADGKNGEPKARNCDLRETRSGIRTTKMKKKF